MRLKRIIVKLIAYSGSPPRGRRLRAGVRVAAEGRGLWLDYRLPIAFSMRFTPSLHYLIDALEEIACRGHLAGEDSLGFPEHVYINRCGTGYSLGQSYIASERNMAISYSRKENGAPPQHGGWCGLAHALGA